MKLKIALILLIVVVLIPIVAADDCCYPPFPSDGTGVLGNEIIIVPSGTNCNTLGGSYVKVEDCTNSNGVIVNSTLKQCCCDNYGNVVDFGASTVGLPPYVVYQEFCLGFSSNPAYTSVQSSPNSNGGSYCECTQSSTQAMHHVTGYVKLTNGTVLSGVTVQAENGFYINDVSDVNGFYDLGDIPGVDNGMNVFSSTIPEGFTADFGSGPVILDCPQVLEQRQFSGAYGQTEINFSMSCQVIGPACEPAWNNSDWSECVPYGGEYIKTREVWDENECNTTLGRPISVLTQTTPLPEGSAYDCPTGVLSGDCNNGVVEAYEQCDTNLSSGTTQYKIFPGGTISQNAPLCSSLGFESGTIGCTIQCGYDYSDCVNQCDVCDDVSKCGVCETCQGNPICEPACDNMTVEFLPNFEDGQRSSERNVLESYGELIYRSGVYYTESSDDVEIAWHIKSQTQACQNKLMGYEVEICEEDETNPNYCVPLTKKTYFAKQGTESIIVPDLLKNTVSNYCYNVCSLLVDGSRKCAYEGTSDNPLACFSVGDEYCYKYHEPGLNCVYDSVSANNQPTGCIVEEINNEFVTNHSLGISAPGCTDYQQCVETKYEPSNGLPGAKCTFPGACDRCNGLFGLFAPQGLKSVINKSGTMETVTNCNLFKYDFISDPLLTPEVDSKVGLCFEDKATKSPFTFYDTCVQVNNCYGYKTQDTCQRDPCFKFSSINNSGEFNGCEWTYTDENLGLGICSPVKEEEQDCSLCDDESPLGFCTEDLCNAYGNCYFKEIQNHNLTGGTPQEEYLFTNDAQLKLVGHFPDPFLSTCVHKRDMACFFYQNEQDCTGLQPSSVDVTYNASGNRIGGTNEQTQESNDLFGLGDCKWVSSGSDVGCYKDSDEYTNPNQPINFSDDCFDKGPYYEGLDCLQDTTPPTTNLTLRDPEYQDQYIGHLGEYLPVYGINELANITYIVSDDVSAEDEIETYFSITPYACSGCNTYPAYELDDYAPDGSEFTSLDNTTSKEYKVTYYSSDVAKNLEVVKTDFIFVDVSGPTLSSYNTTVVSFNMYGDIYSSNVSINFSISEPAYCDGWLTLQIDPNQTIGGEEVHNYGDVFNAEYRYLLDGYYEFHIMCYDDYNNNLDVVKTILVEGNAAITNPLPRGDVFSNVNQVTLSIETQNNADCRFDPESRTYSQSREDFANTGFLSHTHSFLPSNMQILTIDPDESKPYVFYTACEFENGSITEQVDGDVISFTIDKIPPTVDVLAKDPEVTNSDFEPYEMTLASWYYNREFKLICDDYDSSIPVRQFGCSFIEYCFAEGKDLDTFTTADCDGQLYTSTEDEVTFEVTHEDEAYKHLYYRAVDVGGNEGAFERVHMKLRDISYVQPQVYLE